VAALVVLGLAAAVVVSHQLTPFVLVVMLAALVVTRRCRYWWLPLAVVAMTAGWLWLARHYVGAHFDLFASFGDVTANASGSGSGPGSAGHLLVTRVSRVLSGAIWGGALCGVVLGLRAGRREWTAVALAAAALPVVVAQNYGGEAIYRVYLFSAPFCAYLVAGALVGGGSRARRSRRRRGAGWSWTRTVVATVVALALVPLWLVAFDGLLASDLVSPGEVAVDAWFSAHAPPGAVLTEVCCDFPDLFGGDYNLYETPLGTFGTDIASQPGFSGKRLGSADIPRAIRLLNGQLASPIYVALSPSQEAYSAAFGVAPPGATARFEQLLLRDPAFRVVYRSGDSVLLELRPPIGPAVPPAPGGAGP